MSCSLLLLSNVRQGTEPTTQMFQDCSKITQNKEALAARVFVSKRVVEKLDECFKVIGDEPVKLSGLLRDGKTSARLAA
jgi:hypothetical protein